MIACDVNVCITTFLVTVYRVLYTAIIYDSFIIGCIHLYIMGSLRSSFQFGNAYLVTGIYRSSW